MKTEKIFKILGEGGGICISRQKNKIGEKFIYFHNEFDPTDEGLDINEKEVFDNFEQPFQLINRYSWYKLYLETVHDDYRDFIIEKLIEKLNKESISPEYLDHNKDRLENLLRIKLNYKENRNSKTLTWSCDKKE